MEIMKQLEEEFKKDLGFYKQDFCKIKGLISQDNVLFFTTEKIDMIKERLDNLEDRNYYNHLIGINADYIDLIKKVDRKLKEKRKLKKTKLEGLRAYCHKRTGLFIVDLNSVLDLRVIVAPVMSD